MFDPADVVEVRTIRNRQSRTELWCRASDLPSHAERLDTLNRDGWNIYAGANPRKAAGARGDANVLCGRTLFVDADGTPASVLLQAIDAVQLPPPTITIASGHGTHCYWRLAEALEPEHWREWQADIAALLGTDPKVVNPERIMRVPGFDNVKGEPVACEIIDANPARVYDLADLPIGMRAGSDTPPKPVPVFTVRRLKSGRTDPLQQCKRYLARCPDSVAGQRGHDAMYRAACEVVRFDLPEADALDLLAWFNATKCSPPWSDREIAHKLASANRNVAGQRGDRLVVKQATFSVRRVRGAA